MDISIPDQNFEDFLNSSITVIKASKDWHNFSCEVAKVIGIEKACILANIDDSRIKTMKGLIDHFVYIPPERLEILINELIQAGDLEKGGDNEN